MTDDGDTPGTRQWLGFVLGTLTVVAPTAASPDRPQTIAGWALVASGALATGLLAQTTIDQVIRDLRRRRRLPRRSVTKRELLAWVLVLAIIAGCSLAVTVTVPWIWQRWRGCSAALPVPVTAAPSIQVPMQAAAAAWMRGTRGRGGCPRYAVHITATPDAAALAALEDGWPVAAEDPPAPFTSAADWDGRGNSFGPAPLAWFPDDYRRIDALAATDAGLIRRKEFYAASSLVVAMPRELAEDLRTMPGWTMRDLAARAARRGIPLVRPDPDASALGLVATAQLYPGAQPSAQAPAPAAAGAAAQQREIDQLEAGLVTAADRAGLGGGTAAGGAGAGAAGGTGTGAAGGTGAGAAGGTGIGGAGTGQGGAGVRGEPAQHDDIAVTRALCRGRDRDLAFVVTREAFTAVEVAGQEAPAGSVVGCRHPGNRTAAEPAADGLERVGRAVALLDLPQAADRPTPPPEATEAAAAFVSWLQSADGQAVLHVQAGFTRLPPRERRSIPSEQDLDPGRARILADVAQQHRASTARRAMRHDVVVAVDASESMQIVPRSLGVSRYSAVAAALPPALAAGAGPADRVALVLFGGRAATPAVPLSDAATAAPRVGSAILGHAASGGTPLAAAVHRSLDVLGNPRTPGTRRAVLLVTDGPRAADSPPLNAALNRARAAGVAVQVLVVDGRCSPLPPALRTSTTRCRATAGAALPAALSETLAGLRGPGTTSS